MYRTKISIPPDLFRAVRGLRANARRNFNRDLQMTVRPALQQTATRLLGVNPGPVVSGPNNPFRFSSNASRRYYFARFGNQLPYQRRSPGIAGGWIVEIPRSGEKSYVVVYNRFPEATYVYGTPYQRQVPGHKTTGWGRNNKVAFTAIQREAFDLIADAWYQAVSSALAGK